MAVLIRAGKWSQIDPESVAYVKRLVITLLHLVNRKGRMKSLFLFLTCTLLLPAHIVAGGQAESGRPPILATLQRQLTTALHKMDADLSQAATQLSAAGLTGPDARKILLKLCEDNPAAIDCAAVDLAGRMVTLEPEPFKEFEGTDISYQEQVQRLHRTKRPAMSQVIRAVEGIDSVDFEYPIFSGQGQLIGSVSMLLRPESLSSAIIAPAVQGFPVEVWLMQKDGRILYDADPKAIGRNAIHDPLCGPSPQLSSLAKKIANKKSGTGVYKCLRQGLQAPVKKQAFWTTVGLHRTDWRLVVTRVVTGAPASGDKRARADARA